MTRDRQTPRRLSDGKAELSEEQTRTKEMLSRLRPLPDVSPERVERWLQQVTAIKDRRSPRGAWREGRLRPVALRVVGVVFAVVLMGGAVTAAVLLRARQAPQAPRVAAERTAEPSVSPLVAAPQEAVPLEVPAPPERRRVSRRATPAAPSPGAATEASADPLMRETFLVRGALARLRAGDAQGTLATLDAYEREFHKGALSREAHLVRVDALLAARRPDEALRVLERLRLSDLPRRRELQLKRAELRSESGRCADALADFTAVLAEGGTPSISERALFGRAVCRVRMGDAIGARKDAETYLQKHPSGRFANEARRLSSQ